MSVIQGMAGVFSPWQSLYSRSVAVSTTVTIVHIVSLLLGGGLAIAADRSILRALRRPQGERALVVSELAAVHRPVVITLAILLLSGLLLATADIEIFATSSLFWMKMALVALLLLNGAALYRTEKRLVLTVPDPAEDPVRAARLGRRLGRHAGASLGLWMVLAVLGTVLTSTA